MDNTTPADAGVPASSEASAEPKRPRQVIMGGTNPRSARVNRALAHARWLVERENMSVAKACDIAGCATSQYYTRKNEKRLPVAALPNGIGARTAPEDRRPRTLPKATKLKLTDGEAPSPENKLRFLCVAAFDGQEGFDVGVFARADARLMLAMLTLFIENQRLRLRLQDRE